MEILGNHNLLEILNIILFQMHMKNHIDIKLIDLKLKFFMLINIYFCNVLII